MHNVFTEFFGFTLPLIIPYCSIFICGPRGGQWASYRAQVFLHRPSLHHDNKISGNYANFHLVGLFRLVYKVRDDPRASKHPCSVDSAT
jgi:hypothetical protein